MTRAEACDVAVIGGGSAGVAAAVSAARAGARTWLVEKSDRLGGNVAHALVHTICGLYFAADEGEPLLAHAGIPAELARRLSAAGGAAPPERAGRVWYLPVRPEALSASYAELCREARALELRFAAELAGAELARDASGESLLRLGGAMGPAELRAAVVVDASGDAAAAALGGAGTDLAPPDELQCPSYVFRLEGVDTSQLLGFARLQLGAALASGVRGGKLPRGADAIVVRASGRPGEVFATLNLPRPEGEFWAPLDADCLARLERGAHDAAEAIARFLRETRRAFAGATLAEHPRRLGVRETRRVQGLVRVTADDVLAGRRREDEVALSTWPIELWQDHRRPIFEQPAGACSIPLGALISRTHPRLGMAGRCLSATHEAHGALRVIGTALATGEAIGRAAALAADSGKALAEVAPSSVRSQTRGG
ncbi:MAG TPA: FAD-dependent oxidoreductase [Myxococcota bacterium]|nr:FAD-dependent oxidoreductase [Myxococcota bacterium]